MTLAGSPGENPPLTIRTSPAPTMRMSPSTSKPICVSQLKKEMGRDPLGPKAARLVAKAEVPVSGPCSEHRPEQQEREVADDDEGQGLGEGEPECHQDGAVEEVLHLDAGAGPHAEDVLRLAQRSLIGM